MPRLTWDQVAAPNLDTRDIGLAGASIASSFARMGDLLNQRYAQQKQEATNAEIAKQLAIADPEQLAAGFDVSTLNAKADPAAVLMARNARYSEVINQLGAKEDLLNKQVSAKLGAQALPLYEAALRGDKEAAAQIAAKALDDPEWARFLSLKAETFAEFADKGIDNLETARTHRASEADAAVGRGLQAQGLALEGARLSLTREAANAAKTERQLTGANMGIGEEYANKFADLSAPRAFEALTKTKEYQAADAVGRAAMRQGFIPTHAQFNLGATERRAENLPSTTGNPLLAQLNTVSSQLVGKVKMPEIHELMDSWHTSGSTRADKALSAVPGATPADLAAVVQTYGYVSQDHLEKTMKAMVDEREFSGLNVKLLQLQQREATILAEAAPGMDAKLQTIRKNMEEIEERLKNKALPVLPEPRAKAPQVTPFLSK